MLYPDFNELVALKERGSTSPAAALRKVKTGVSGSHASPFRGQGLEFDSVREYVPGDDIRNIDWRVTARMGSPHLKLFKEERERHRVLCVDMNAGMRFGTRNTFKSVQAARIAAFLGWQGLAHQDRVSAYLFGDVTGNFSRGIHYFAPKRTRQSFYTFLKQLCVPSSTPHPISLTEALKPISGAVHTGSLVYLISDFMDMSPDLMEDAGLNRLNRRGELVFISINDPTEQSLIPVGTLGFCSASGDKIRIDTDNRSGREAYQAQWQKNRQSLRELTTKLKIPLIELTTESDIPQDLLKGLRALSKRRRP